MKSFERYHSDNPLVFMSLVYLTKQLLAKGHAKVCFDQVWERMRWEVRKTNPNTKPHKAFKASYCRLIESSEPELRGVFGAPMAAVLTHDPTANAMTLTVSPTRVRA